MRVRHFDSRELVTEQGIHRSFAEVLQFPSYYGANWDALVDCLSDLCGTVTGGVGIVGVTHDADLILDAEHFPQRIARRIRHPDLTVTTRADHVAAALNPEVWH